MDKTECELRYVAVESEPQTSQRGIGYVERTLTGRRGAAPAAVVIVVLLVTFARAGIPLSNRSGEGIR